MVPRGASQAQAPCLENGKCLLHLHCQGELRVKVRLGRSSQFRELFRTETSLVNMVEGSNRLYLQHCLLSTTILCSASRQKIITS